MHWTWKLNLNGRIDIQTTNRSHKTEIWTVLYVIFFLFFFAWPMNLRYVDLISLTEGVKIPVMKHCLQSMWKTILVTDCNYYELKLNYVYLMKGRRLNQMNRTSVHESRDASGATAFLSSLPVLNTHTLTYTHTLTHTHSLTHTHTHTHSPTHTHTRTLSHTLIHTHTHSLTHSLIHTNTLSYTHSHTHTHKHTHTHTHALLSHTHFCWLQWICWMMSVMITGGIFCLVHLSHTL